MLDLSEQSNDLFTYQKYCVVNSHTENSKSSIRERQNERRENQKFSPSKGTTEREPNAVFEFSKKRKY